MNITRHYYFPYLYNELDMQMIERPKSAPPHIGKVHSPLLSDDSSEGSTKSNLYHIINESSSEV